MQYLTKLSTSPIEPISLTDMLTWLKQDPGVDDDLIQSLISAARLWAEGFQRRSLISEQWQLKLDRFPFYCFREGICLLEGELGLWELPNGIYHRDAARYAIELPRSPLLSVDSFTYLDPSGATQTLAAGAYQTLTGDDVEPRLFPLDGTYWPFTCFDPAAVTITFTAGFGNYSLPSNTVTALKMMVAAWYADREGAQAIPPTVKTLLNLNRAYEF